MVKEKCEVAEPSGWRIPNAVLAQRPGRVRELYAVGVVPIISMRRYGRIFFDGAQQAWRSWCLE